MADQDKQHSAVDSSAKERDDLAENRTDLAEDRTVLANERTFAGWFRTGLGTVGIGLAFHALFIHMQPWWVPRGIATVFLALGIYLFISAEYRACVVLGRLSAHRVTPIRDRGLKVIAYVSSFAVLALIAALWLLAV